MTIAVSPRKPVGQQQHSTHRFDATSEVLGVRLAASAFRERSSASFGAAAPPAPSVSLRRQRRANGAHKPSGARMFSWI
jgi:hypothetical protein